MAITASASPRSSAGLVLPGLLLGAGLGGFVDGILLHQILQWHHMLTSEGSYPATTVTGLEVNTLWDGFFHAATYIATAAGLLILASRVSRGVAWSTRMLIGLLLAGWGSFNLVEGVVNHHILGIHHVRPTFRRSTSPFWLWERPSCSGVSPSRGAASARRGRARRVCELEQLRHRGPVARGHLDTEAENR